MRAALRAHGFTCCDDDGDPDSASASLVGRRLEKQFVPPGGGRLKPFVGKVDSFDGTYYRMATAQCNGKPVYHLGDSHEGYVLFQPERRPYWDVGSIERGGDRGEAARKCCACLLSYRASLLP